MHLLDLPKELLSIICLQCRQTDLPRLRLTCKTIHDVADKYFLQELRLYYTADSTRMAEVLSKSRLAKNIQSCWFQADRVEEHTRFSFWARDVREYFLYAPEEFKELTGLEPSREAYQEAFYGKYFARYRQLCRDYHDLHRTADIYTQLSTLFKTCPRLKQLWLTLESETREVRRCSDTRPFAKHSHFRSVVLYAWAKARSLSRRCSGLQLMPMYSSTRWSQGH